MGHDIDEGWRGCRTQHLVRTRPGLRVSARRTDRGRRVDRTGTPEGGLRRLAVQAGPDLAQSTDDCLPPLQDAGRQTRLCGEALRNAATGPARAVLLPDRARKRRRLRLSALV